MITEEKRRSIREETRGKIADGVAVMRKAIFFPSPGRTSSDVVEDLGGVLADSQLISPLKAPATTALALALYKSKTIDEYTAIAAVEFVNNRPEIAVLLYRLSTEPDQLTQGEFSTLITAMLEDDRLFLGSAKVCLDDPGVRAALNLPETFDSEDYIQKTKSDLRSSRSWEEFVELHREHGYLGPVVCTEVALCIWVAVVAITAAVVGTVVVAGGFATFGATINIASTYNTVSVYSAIGHSPSDFMPFLDIEAGPVSAIVQNQSSSTVWVIVKSPKYGHRRIPIPSGKNSMEIGLRRPLAILVGGSGNGIASYADLAEKKHFNGAVLIEQSELAPGSLIINDEGIVGNNIQDQAAMLGRAGFTDWSYITLENDLPFVSMETVSVGLVEGFDIFGMGVDQVDASHFYKVLKIKNRLQVLQAVHNA